MQRLRETFRRSKGPAIESQLPTSVSLEVPKQVRSASFDEIRFKKEHDQDYASGDNLLAVPSTRNQRSRSFDSATTASASSSAAPPVTSVSAPPSAVPPGMVTGTGSSSGAGCGVSSLPMPSPPAIATDAPCQLDVPKWRLLRRSSSDKSQCSACIHCQYMDEFSRNTSRSNSPPDRLRYFSSGSETLEESESESAGGGMSPRPEDEQVTDVEEDLLVSPTSCGLMVTLSVPDSGHRASLGGDAGVTVVSLQVPQVAKGRSASVDSSFLQVPTPDPDLDPDLAAKAHRSRSVDIVLPTGAEPRYALCQPKERGHARKAIQGEVKLPTENGDTRQYRATPDWGESAINGDHLWTATSASGDLCYVGESECSKHGPRMKCPACKITVHAGCISILSDKMKFQCKPTFRDVGIRQYREQTVIQHHWVHRRYEKGKCQQCSKSFQSKLSFGSKEIVAISCTWCKTAYHNKESCFSMQRIGEQCNLGSHMDIIVPPSWIVKLPRKGSFKSSIRRSPKKRASTKKKSRKEGCGEKDAQRAFAIKPIPCASCKPLLVFINPRSGGNQGSKMMQKFQWLLNPRQVFDLSQGGPTQGLELYRKVSNLRILACGGDGTAGWILSVLDEIGIVPPPPVAVLPLGTGNDLARALGWGGGYTDEPISKILQDVQNGDIVQLDRWDLIVNRNPEVDVTQCEEGKEIVPLNVVNNYFSIGVDAHIALEFHEAREAHPERFNSRLKNKMFYGQAGGRDLLQRKWKDLCNYVTLECDGQDYTAKLREHKVHSILFLNIPSYGGGTRPWGNPGTSFESPQTDDGLIEVIGLTIYQMPFLQAGGHGTCLCQCRSARVVTSKTIPVQVDGEPCRLLPSLIELRMRNKACMVAKTKIHNQVPSQLPLEKLTISIRKLNMADYENYHYDKDRLRTLSIHIGNLSVNPDTDLENVRLMINQLCSLEGPDAQNLSPSKRFSPDWCFLDSCTAERFFRIDRAQEQLHYVVDIGQDGVYILDPEQSPIAPEPPPPSLTSPTAEDARVLEGLSATRGSDDSLAAVPAAPAKAEAKELAPTWSIPSGAQDSGEQKVEAEEQPASSQEVIIAAKMGDLLRLKQLCDSGHTLLSVDDSGMTALHHASRYGHKDIVRYIVASASPTILDITDREKGQTALHKAAAYKRRTICCMLVAAGASLSKADCQGQTAKQLAARAGDEDLAAYLESQEHFERLVQDRETAV